MIIGVVYAEMTRADVVAFLEFVDELGIGVWLCGGWSVDALVTEQTRHHGDLDVIVGAADAALLMQHLRARGFAAITRGFTTPWRQVFADSHGRELDLHLIEFDGSGAARFDDIVFPAGALDSVGVIGTRTVRCLAPREQLGFYTGYEPGADDWHDVSLLCSRFGLTVPDDYSRFVGGAD